MTIGQGANGLRAHDLRALPGLLKRVSEEERQPGQVEPDGTPGVRIDQGEKVLVVLLVGNLVGASIESGGDAAHGAGVCVARRVGEVV